MEVFYLAQVTREDFVAGVTGVYLYTVVVTVWTREGFVGVDDPEVFLDFNLQTVAVGNTRYTPTK